MSESWRTRNYVGAIYGGSLYGVVDPLYMLMLIRCLGPEYVVRDKSASVRFKRPGRTRLFATFRLDASMLEEIRRQLDRVPTLDRQFAIDLTDRAGTVPAQVEKTIHLSKRATPTP